MAVVMLVCLDSGVLADGCFFAVGADVYAPDQKAVIAWDGAVETMILATKLRADDVSDFGWIIPIKTVEMPKVELGEAVVFEYLSEYFQVFQGKKGKGGGGGLSGPLDAVTVLAKLELAAFDVTILKATDSGQLHEWLTRNAFKLHPDTEPVLAHYTNEEFFFITAKIAADRLGTNAKSKLQRGIYHPLKITFKADEPFFPLKISSINKGPVKITVYVFAKGPKRDRSGILEISKWQPVTSDMSRRMDYYLPVAGLPQVTRLTFDGDSKRFAKDVYFQDMSTRERREFFREDYTQMDFSPERFFRDALTRGTVDEIQREIANADLWAPDNRRSYLETAIESGSAEGVRLITEAGAELHGILDYAVRYGSYDIVEYLLTQGARLEGKFGGGYVIESRRRWLMDAARKGSTAIVEVLLQCGLSANGPQTMPYEYTPLMTAVQAGHHETTELLLDKGADINALVRASGSFYVGYREPRRSQAVCTALDAAVAGGDAEMVRILLAHGAGTDGVSAKKDARFDVRPPVHPLVAASVDGRLEIVKLLLATQVTAGDGRPADANNLDWPLIVAATHGHLEVVKELVTVGARSSDAMMVAAEHGYLEVVKVLVDEGAGEEAAGAPYEAAKNGHWQVVRFLIERDVSVHPQYNLRVLANRYAMLKRGMTPEDVDRTLSVHSGTAAQYLAGPQAGIKLRLFDVYPTWGTPFPTVPTSACLIFRDGKLVEFGEAKILLKYLE